MVHSYDGNVKVREMAVVKVILGDVTFTEKVALASMVELGGKALLSLPLLHQDKRTILLDALQKQKAVCAVQTRSMVEKEKKLDAIECTKLENENVQNVRPLPTVSEGSCEVVPL